MISLLIKPRKKPALLAASALLILCAVLWMFSRVDGAPVGMIGGLLAMSLAMFIAILTGLMRTRLIFTEHGVESVSSAFSKKKSWRWKEVRQCILAGSQYALYAKDGSWIGAFDFRNEKAKEALEVLRRKHIAVTKEKTD